MAVSTIDPNGLNVGQLGGRRNRIINSAMLIDQRHGGSSWNATNGGFSLDRWKVNSFNGGAATGIFSVQQSSTAPDGFSNSLLVTSLATTADAASNIFNVEQLIEGYNTFDFAFGTSSAKTITLSFWVRSSLTGTFGGAIKNSARNRAYPFTYTISSANTFEYKIITIDGDTSGTWVGASTSTGVWLSFGLGVGSSYSGTAGAWNSSDNFSATGATSVVGTSGATWYLTGVQLEVSPSGEATPHEHRSYDEEYRACQRYYIQDGGGAYASLLGGQGFNITTTLCAMKTYLPVVMRVNPTFSYTGTPRVQNGQGGYNLTNLTGGFPSGTGGKLNMYNMTGTSSGMTLFQPMNIDGNAGGSTVYLDAEL